MVPEAAVSVRVYVPAGVPGEPLLGGVTGGGVTGGGVPGGVGEEPELLLPPPPQPIVAIARQNNNPHSERPMRLREKEANGSTTSATSADVSSHPCEARTALSGPRCA